MPDARSPRRAILVMCAGVFFLVLNDAMSKWLVERYTPLQILFVRSLLALPMIVAAVAVVGDWKALKTARLRIHVWRGFFAVAATYAFIRSLASLPLAEATSLIFTAPLFVAALSAPLLGERVSWRRGAVVVLGFLGALIVVRPGTATFQAASVFALSAAVLNALIMISSRWIDARDNVWTMLFYMSLFPALLSAFVVFTPWPAFQAMDAALFVGTAVLGTLGIGIISQAFRMAAAAVVAPLDYTALIWASLIGWLVWGAVPDVLTYLGAAVIIASGVYVIVAEARTST